MPEPIFGSRDLNIRIVDTKGIDQAAERQDIECHFDDPRTLVVLCSRFNDAQKLPCKTCYAVQKKPVPATSLRKQSCLFFRGLTRRWQLNTTMERAS